MITVVGSAFRIREETAELWVAFLTEFDATVEPLDIDAITDDWSWACRAVRGSATTASDHSWGLAVDLNAPRHPLGTEGTFTDGQVRAIRGLLAQPRFRNFRWGGDYFSRADEMHFFYAGTPADADADTALLLEDDMTREEFRAELKAACEKGGPIYNLYHVLEYGKFYGHEGADPARTGLNELKAQIAGLPAAVAALIPATSGTAGVPAGSFPGTVTITVEPTP